MFLSVNQHILGQLLNFKELKAIRLIDPNSKHNAIMNMSSFSTILSELEKMT